MADQERTGDGGGGEADAPRSNNLAAPGVDNGESRVSSFLLRRMAEAADGERDKDVFCTARFKANKMFDFDVKLHEDVHAADAARNGSAEFGVFGPFHTPGGNGPSLETSLIESITVTLKDGGGVIDIDPTKSDSLFWTVSAVEKFLVPYYSSVLSASKASLVHTTFDQAGMLIVEHGPNTEVTVLGDKGVPVAPVPTGVSADDGSENLLRAQINEEAAKPVLGVRFFVRKPPAKEAAKEAEPETESGLAAEKEPLKP
ncbi:MAG TPA: hypothetical protein VM890_09695 [Longimicrobium sp.]|jgi:hypothetical protein|nr:hypothetical protein [Longimicrobium sp.]